MGERKEKQEVAKVEHKEKSLVSMHFKVLDSASPLLFIAESLAAENARVNSDMRDTCSNAIRGI